MNSKFLPVLLLVFSVISSVTTFSYAQVTVGTGLEPANGALIDFKEKAVDPTTFDNSSKGVLFPKVVLVAQDTLRPVIPGVATAQDSLLTTGMVVYNVASSVGNGAGLYVWNGSQWFPLFGSSSGYATFQTPFDCASVNTNGTYTKGIPLVSTTNYIDINVTVVKPGTYNAVAAQTGASNGYYFSASGTFKMAGTYTIRLAGMGTPTNSNNTSMPTSWDQFQLSINGVDTGCTTAIPVEAGAINYQIICGSVLVNGTYSVGTALTASNTITLNVTSPQSAAGSMYTILTDSLNGLYFVAAGYLSGGTQTITLEGYGTPLESQQTYFTISSSSNTPNTCNAVANVLARNVSIYSFGGYWYSLAAMQTDGTGATYYLLNNPALFGPSTATYPIAGFTQTPTPSLSTYGNLQNLSNLTATQLQAYINTSKPDIITGGYEWTDVGSASAAEAVSLARVLAQYVRQGGVLIFYDDIPGVSTTGDYAVELNLIDSIFNNPSLTITGGSNGPNTVPIVSGFPSIINGLFMNLAGTTVQCDGANNGYVVGSDPNMIPLAQDATGARAVVHKDLGFFFSGDGGIFTGNSSDQSTDAWPLKVTSSGSPDYYSTPYVFTADNSSNAFLFLNVMVWAINKAQQNRPTGTEPFNILLP